MQVTISPSRAVGTVKAPPSKSMAHRLLICGGLSSGKSIIHGVSFSQDVLATIDCLTALGAEITSEGDTVYIKGTDPSRFNGENRLYCRECGSTLRFMIPICMLSSAETTLCGSSKLMSRPLDVYSEISAERNLDFRLCGDKLNLKGPLTSGRFKVKGNISSQFISGLLFALPLLQGDSTLEIIPPVESKPYIDMTLRALSVFGIEIVELKENLFLIKGSQKYKSCETTVEGDFSNAAFLEALNLTGGDVKVTGLDMESLQGDRVYFKAYRDLQRGFCSIDISNCPDLGPVLFAAAALLSGAEFTGTSRLRIKESDRGAAMAEELSKFGVCVNLTENTALVKGGKLKAPTEPLSSHNDHRIVMALSVLLTKVGGTIYGAQAVNKSYPDFFDCLRNLGVKVECYGMDSKN